jgi:cytochrome P450
VRQYWYDLHNEFAAPFAARTLAYVLGLPTATEDEMQRWSQAFVDGIGNYADDPTIWARADRSARELERAIDEHLPRVRAHPDGSVLSSMVHAPVDPPLGLEEIYANMKLIIAGGLNEPRDTIGIALWGLLTHPDQAAFVRSEPR